MKKPVHEIRLGLVVAAIWANDGQRGTFHNVTITRLYKDGDDWKRTSSLGRDDLPLAMKVCDMAHTWIYSQSQTSNADNSQQADAPAADNAFVAAAKQQFGGTSIVVAGSTPDDDIPF